MADDTKVVGTYPMAPSERVGLGVDFADELVGAQEVTGYGATLVELPSRTDVSDDYLESPLGLQGSTVTAWVKPGLVRGRTYELLIVATLAVPAGAVGPTLERRVVIPCV